MKMKRRIFTLALVALLAISGLWAVDSQTANVDLTLNLIGDTVIGWFPGDSEPTLENWDSAKLAEDSDQAFENDAADTIGLWAAVKSNENVQFKLEVTGEAMGSAAGSVDTTIGIHAVGEDGGFGTASIEFTDVSQKLSMSEESSSGTRVFAGKVTFSMDGEDFAAALAADDYSADITLTASPIE